MQTFLLYMIKSSTILIVLLTYYQFFLKRQTFFNLNRIFLLGVLILSALLPFISIEINRNDMIGFPTLASVSELLEENQIGKSSQSTLITATEQPIPMIPLLYGIGVVFFFFTPSTASALGVRLLCSEMCLRFRNTSFYNKKLPSDCPFPFFLQLVFPLS